MNTSDNDVVGCTNLQWTGDHLDKRSASGFCTFVGNNLVTGRSKQQNLVTRSSAEVEYWNMTHTTGDIFLGGDFSNDKPMKMFCDNKAAINIVTTRDPNIEIDHHFV